MTWTPATLDAAVGQYLLFPDGSSRLLQKSSKGYLIGQSRQPVSAKAAITHLNYQNVALANPRVHV